MYVDAILEQFNLDPLKVIDEPTLESVLQDYKESVDYAEEIYKEAVTGTTKKNLFQKLWGYIVKAIQFIKKKLDQFMNWIKKKFSRGQKKTMDDVAEEVFGDGKGGSTGGKAASAPKSIPRMKDLTVDKGRLAREGITQNVYDNPVKSEPKSTTAQIQQNNDKLSNLKHDMSDLKHRMDNDNQENKDFLDNVEKQLGINKSKTSTNTPIPAAKSPAENKEINISIRETEPINIDDASYDLICIWGNNDSIIVKPANDTDHYDDYIISALAFIKSPQYIDLMYKVIDFIKDKGSNTAKGFENDFDDYFNKLGEDIEKNIENYSNSEEISVSMSEIQQANQSIDKLIINVNNVSHELITTQKFRYDMLNMISDNLRNVQRGLVKLLTNIKRSYSLPSKKYKNAAKTIYDINKFVGSAITMKIPAFSILESIKVIAPESYTIYEITANYGDNVNATVEIPVNPKDVCIIFDEENSAYLVALNKIGVNTFYDISSGSPKDLEIFYNDNGGRTFRTNKSLMNEYTIIPLTSVY